MKNFRISIIIPTYQGANYLENAIQSVIGQHYPDLELIIIDGGSLDGSVEIIRKFESAISYWVSEPDRGQSDAINKGFAKSTGEIITFLSSDDTYVPGTLEDVATQFQEAPNIGAVVGAFQFLDQASGRISNPIGPFLEQPTPLDLTLVEPSRYRLHQVSTFYSRTALEKVGFWVQENLKFVMDRELLFRVCLKCPILLVDRVYGVFRRHDSSKSIQTVMPFAEEFSELYLSRITGDPSKDNIRILNAKYFLASGWLKHAKMAEEIRIAIPALLRTLLIEPRFIFKFSYLAAWRFVIKKWGNRLSNQ